MSTPETLLRTVEDARRILGEYIEPGQRKACSPFLDRNDVVHALDRLKWQRVVRRVG
jgi:hypothetical protein